MTDTYKLVFSGQVAAGHTVDQVRQRLAVLLKVPIDKAHLLFSGNPISLKENIDYDTALKYKTAVERTGALAAIEPMAAASVSLNKNPPPRPAAPPPPPPPRSAAVEHDYYAAPRAPLVDDSAETVDLQLHEPRATPAGHGWLWISRAFELFRQAPGTWIGMLIIWVIIMFAAALIPLVNMIAPYLLGPVLTAGFMVGCYVLDNQGELRIAHLFAGFQQQAGRLFALGGLYLGAMVLLGLLLLLLLFVFGGSFYFFFNGVTESGQNFGPVDPIMVGLPFLLLLLVALALSVPLAMAFWFAPVLVMLHEVGVFDAIKLSFKGCWRNAVPFLIYGLILLGLSLLATIPLGLGWLVLGPVLAASLYTAHKDIFIEDIE